MADPEPEFPNLNHPNFRVRVFAYHAGYPTIRCPKFGCARGTAHTHLLLIPVVPVKPVYFESSFEFRVRSRGLFTGTSYGSLDGGIFKSKSCSDHDASRYMPTDIHSHPSAVCRVVESTIVNSSSRSCGDTREGPKIANTQIRSHKTPCTTKATYNR